MKKQERMTTPVKASDTGVSVNSQAGMKESRSDNFLTKQQKSTTFAKPVGSPLGKTYLSKSHENLSSHQKKKLAAYIDHRPKSSLGLPKRDPASKYIGSSNKENLLIKDKDKGSGFLKPKPVKSGGLTPIRKASSTQNIDKTSSSSRSTHSNKMQSMKRAHSTHNVSKEKSSRKRTSAPADVMAYNAELLANFEKDKRGLESRISELIQVAENRKAEIEKYRYETKRLKEQIPSHDVKDELDFLRKENKLLQEQLRELGYPVEQITDSEKLSLLQQKNLAGKSSNKNGDVASCGCQIPKSKSCDSLSTDGARGQVSIGSQLGEYVEPSTSITASEPAMSLGDLCGTPEHPSMFSLDCGNWEKGSNKSSDALSEISVACLTERILQMEETHYSTNEELQATLQELGDLQSNVNELNSENERLHDEKYVLLESLCTQTEKLEHCRTQIEQLKALLISGNFPERSEREQQLLELLKGAQDEREELLYKQVELANAFHSLELERRETSDVADSLRERLQLLDDKLNSVKAEKEADEKLITECKTNIANDKIELDHYKTLLENEKTKVQELEKYCEASDSHSDVEQLLRNTRQEKDKLEEKLANMKESLLHGQCEIKNLQESLNQKEEELKVCKNNAKTQISDYEFKIERLEKGKTDYHSELASMREHVSQLEQDCDQYLEEKKEYSKKLAELQVDMKALQQEKVIRDSELSELRAKHQEESEEWRQFQKDLQVAVLVANDFRAETQDDMDKLLQENSTMKEKCKLLEEENKKLQDDVLFIKSQKAAEEKTTPKSILSSAELKGKVLGTVDRELMVLRDKRQENKNQSQSVKSLIRSIEEQVKSGCSSLHSSSGNSRRNSDCSVDESLPGMQRLHQIIKSPTSPITDNQSVFNTSSPEVTLRSVLKKAPEKPSPLRHSVASLTFDPPRSPCEPAPKSAPPVGKNDSSPTITSILSRGPRRSSGVSIEPDRKESATKDPLTILAKQMGGSKRNALLKWCQQKTIKYSGVDITNFSSSWNDGLAFCALLHSYLPNRIHYEELDTDDKRRNFNMAFEAAESVGISSSILNINDMVAMERPDWQAVMAYVTSIYKHFEIDGKTDSKSN